jgi:hypothetical protein
MIYRQIEDKQPFLVNAYKEKENISLVLVNQAKLLINASEFVMMVIKQNDSQPLEGEASNHSYIIEQ